MRKANEQLKLYKELYSTNLDNFETSPNKLLSMASDKDKEKIQEIFDKYENMNKDDIKAQINLVKQQLEMLEERKTNHQGVKLARVMYGYEPSEEAMKNIREFYKDDKNKKD